MYSAAKKLAGGAGAIGLKLSCGLSKALPDSTEKLLRLWACAGIAPGYQYMTVDRLAPTRRRVLSTRLPNNISMDCDLSEHVDRRIYFQGVYEPLESWLFCSLLKEGMVVVDAGANVGQYSLLASTAVGDSGQVHSFEPVPQNYERLQGNVHKNGLNNILTNRAALWRTAATLSFGKPEGYAGNSGAYRAQSEGFPVNAVSLDEYAKRFTRLDLLKMDVEGSELLVIEGAEEAIRRFSPMIIMEVNESALENAGTSSQALWDLLSSLRYEVIQIGFDPEDRKTLTSFNGIKQANVLAYKVGFDNSAFASISQREILKWARSGW